MAYKQELLPGQLYALESDPEALKSLYGESQFFRIARKTFEWKVADYDSSLNREKNDQPLNNGLVVGVRCLEIDFDIELPIWTQGLGTTNKLYPEQGTPVSIWDRWHINSVIVFGEHFPLYDGSEKPCHVGLRKSYFWGDANTLTTKDVVSIVQKLLFPRKSYRNYVYKRDWIKQVTWKPQCFTDRIDFVSKKISQKSIPQEYLKMEDLELWLPEYIDLAIEEKVELNQYDAQWEGPLSRCITNGDEERFELVIKNGGDINMPSEHTRFTPLHRAVEPGSKKYFLKRLLELGANIEAIETFRDRTPLGHAVRLGNLEAVKILIDAGANLIVNRISKQSPIDIAFEKDQMEIIEYLSQFREARNRSWSRRLLFSAQRLDADQIIWLLNKGANPRTKDNKGCTPSDLILETMNRDSRFFTIQTRRHRDQLKNSFITMGLLEGKISPEKYRKHLIHTPKKKR